MLSFLLTEEMKPFIVCVDISPFLPSCPLNDDQITMLWRNFIIKNWTDIKQTKKTTNANLLYDHAIQSILTLSN